MATANQIYNFVNDVRKDAFGVNTGVQVRDTSSLVSFGDWVFNSGNDDSKSQFWKALIHKVGRTTIAIRKYERRGRKVIKDPIEWGLILEKISYTIGDAIENKSWTAQGDSDPFNITGSVTVTAKYFKSLDTWERDQFIPDFQLYTAFRSPERMGAFITGLFTALDNALELELERVGAMAVNTYMAKALSESNNNVNMKRNLLAEYNTITNAGLTVLKAKTDVDFLKFASKEIKLATDRLDTYSTIFNMDRQQRLTPKDKLVVEILSEFAAITDTYLMSDTYHNELVKLPNYESVPYWQSTGTGFKWEDTSKINIKIDDATTVEKGNIIAFIHDIDAVSATADRIRTKSIYDPQKEQTNYFKKADVGYAVDMSENGIVFYMEEV